MEGEPKQPKPGRILTHKYDNAPREMVPEAAWLDIWQHDRVQAIGEIFNMGNSRSVSGTGSQELFHLLTGENPTILMDEFEEATLEWLSQGSHTWDQYIRLFDGLEHQNQFLSPIILDWFLTHLDSLKEIPGPPHHGWSNFIEKLSGLKEGKSLEELKREWMIKRRAAVKSKPVQNE